MSTECTVSALFPMPVAELWPLLSSFMHPAKYLVPFVYTSCTLTSGASDHELGAVRELRYTDGLVHKHRLSELSYLERRMRWSTEGAGAQIGGLLRCIPASVDQVTLVELQYLYAPGQTNSALADRKHGLALLRALRNAVTQTPLGSVVHVHEGPSARVVWLARELSLPLRVGQRNMLRASLSSLTETPATQGGLVSVYTSPEGATILESGAIITFLLERYDRAALFSPPVGTPERARYLQAFFLATSTVDGLVVSGYKESQMAHEEESDDSGAAERRHTAQLAQLRSRWDEIVAPIVIRTVGAGPWVCGATFSAADVMLGWSLYMADLIDWLAAHEPLRVYMQRVKGRPHFQAAMDL